MNHILDKLKTFPDLHHQVEGFSSMYMKDNLIQHIFDGWGFSYWFLIVMGQYVSKPLMSFHSPESKVLVADTKRSDGQNCHVYGDLYGGKIIAEFCGSQQQEFIGCWITPEEISVQANDHFHLCMPGTIG